MSVRAIEDAIIARLTTRFRGRLRAIESKPVKMDPDELKRVLTLAPAAYVAYLGFARRERPPGTVTASFGIYLVAQHAHEALRRRGGAPGEIGAYDMEGIAVRALEDWGPSAAAGAFEVRSSEPIAAAAFEKAGLSVFGLVADVPMKITAASGWNPGPVDGQPSDPADDPEAELADFLVFHADWDVPPHGNVVPPLPAASPDAADHVVIPSP